MLNTNTFGASAPKLAGSGYTVEQVVQAAVALCRQAAEPFGALTALDIGPLGEMLEPGGPLSFEQAVEEFGRIVRAGAQAGADLVFLETFTDLYELKAALLAVKENSSLPVLASMSFEAGGRTFTGCTPGELCGNGPRPGGGCCGHQLLAGSKGDRPHRPPSGGCASGRLPAVCQAQRRLAPGRRPAAMT